MTSAQLINQSSGDVEIFTPPNIIEAARVALGGRIELDPASCEAANRIVKAETYYTKEDDGLKQDWGFNETIWLNHPFSRADNAKWINKLIASSMVADAACCITFASTSEEWFRPLLEYPQCYLWPRTNYMLPDGTVYRGVTKGSVVTYLGPDLELFRKAFQGMGTVKV